MNRNYYIYEKDNPLLNASLFTLKFEFRPDSLIAIPETRGSFSQNNKKLF